MNSTATVISAEIRQVGQNETPCITLKLELGDQDAVAAVGGKSVYWDGYLTEKAIDNTWSRLKEATGVEITDWGNLSSLEGARVSVTLEQEGYNGKAFWRVKYLNNIARKANAPSADLVASLNAKLRARGVVNVQSTVNDDVLF